MSSSTEHVLHWSNYSAKAIAQIQARGMPIDTYLWNLVQEHKPEIIRYADPTIRSKLWQRQSRSTTRRGHSATSGLRLAQAIGCTAWPRLESGRLDIDGDAFRLMYHIPGIEGLHALRDSLGVIVRAKLPIGADGRNRPKLFPFCTATGRNAHAQSLYNAHASVRSFMVFPKARSELISTGGRKKLVSPPHAWR